MRQQPVLGDLSRQFLTTRLIFDWEKSLLIRRSGREQLSLGLAGFSLGLEKAHLGLGLLRRQSKLSVRRGLNLLGRAQGLVGLERVHDGTIDALRVHDPDVLRDRRRAIKLGKLKAGSFEGHGINW